MTSADSAYSTETPALGSSGRESTAPETAAPATSSAPLPATGRVQLALNVDHLDTAVAFYTRLLGTPPAKLRPGYANFAVAAPPLKLVLLENPGKGGSLNHLGVEVPTADALHSEISRLSAEGLVAEEERGTTCCFATQDKVWVTGPAGERWEVYTVLADSPTFGTGPQALTGTAEASDSGACCATTPGPAAAPAGHRDTCC